MREVFPDYATNVSAFHRRCVRHLNVVRGQEPLCEVVRAAGVPAFQLKASDPRWCRHSMLVPPRCGSESDYDII